jgi:hypothetical protein
LKLSFISFYCGQTYGTFEAKQFILFFLISYEKYFSICTVLFASIKEMQSLKYGITKKYSRI